jgi:GNAT superfamily N-acetyltransferase
MDFDVRSGGNLTIRRAEPTDIDALVTLCTEHANYEGAIYESEGKASRLAAAMFSHAPRLYAWVAMVDEIHVGFATAALEYSTWSASDYLHMDCLFVKASQRGLRIGAGLLKCVVQLASERGLQEVQWQTPSWNSDAARFYRREGGIDQQKLRFVLGVA